LLSPRTITVILLSAQIDNQWMHNPRDRSVDDGLGGKNNVIVVRPSDFEVFDALDMDTKDADSMKQQQRMQLRQAGMGEDYSTNSTDTTDDDGVYTQDIPAYALLGSAGYSGQYRRPPGPPILPPHLLQVQPQ
jgi:hypothetical protein